MAELDVPSLWIFGGADDSIPTEWSIEKLVDLHREGAPVETLLYPEANHGITRYVDTDDGGKRFLGYEPEYRPAMVEWLRRWSDLGPDGS